ncbi:MAG: hypothetical protein ACI9DC_001661 [Gammaproteobacteria bacterium]
MYSFVLVEWLHADGPAAAETSAQKNQRKETARAQRPLHPSERDFCSVI